MPAQDVLELVREGISFDAIIRDDYPDLALEDIQACVRCATDVLAAYGAPFYATSANPSGGPAPNGLDDVDPGVLAVADAVVAGGPGSGEASAVVDLSGENVRILRPTARLTERTLSRLAAEDAGEGRA